MATKKLGNKTRKKNASKIVGTKTIIKTIPSQTEKILVQNFIGLQKVMVNLSSRFDELSGRISKLLELFEISAKAIAEKDLDFEKKEDDTAELLEKVNDLFEQNKIIARGVSLLHEKPIEKTFAKTPTPVLHAPMIKQKIRPKINNPKKEEIVPKENLISNTNQEKYQKSLVSEESEDPFKDVII